MFRKLVAFADIFAIITASIPTFEETVEGFFLFETVEIWIFIVGRVG